MCSKNLFSFLKRTYKLLKILRRISLKSLLLHIQPAHHNFRLHFIKVVTPLGQAFDFFNIVKILSPLRLDNPKFFQRLFNNEIRIKISYEPISVFVVNLQVNGKIVLRVGNNVFAPLQKTGEFQFKMAVTDYFVEG